MHKINVFQNELDLHEEFWYQHSKLANVTPNISTGYFTFSVYHNLPLKKTFKNKPPTCIDEYKYAVALYLEHYEDKKRCYSYLKKLLFFSFFFCKI